MSASTNQSLFDKFIFTIDELYVYIHRKSIKENDPINGILFGTIGTIFSIIMIKLFIIFVCFFLKWILIDLFIIIGKLFKYKCSTLIKEFKYNFSYFQKITKKIFTYNFYAFDREIYGNIFIIFIPIVYIIFNLSNFIFCIDKIFGSEDTKFSNIMLIIIFYFHLFIEIYCASFYIFSNLLNHIKFTCISFMIFSLNVIFLFLFLIQLNESDIKDKLYYEFWERIGRLLFLIFFLILYSKSIKNTYYYDMNKTSLTNLMLGRLEFYQHIDNKLGEQIIKIELEELKDMDNINFDSMFKNCYSTPGKANFFKKRDRFYHKKKILFLLCLIFSIHSLELIYTLYRIFYYLLNSPGEDNIFLKLKEFMNYVSLSHTLIVIFQSMLIFLKCEIRTIFLY